MHKAVAVAAAFFISAALASRAAADTGLVGQWGLDEGVGTVVGDSSGHGNNGSLLGNAQWVTGHAGSGLAFDGVNSGVRVFDNNSLEPSGAVTVSAWFKGDGSPGQFKYLVAKGGSGCIAASFGLYSGPTGGIEFYVSYNRGQSYTQSPDAGTGVWDGNWHLAVGVYDGSEVRLYVDGSEIGTGTPHTGPLEYLLPDSNDLFIGNYAACQQRTFKGVIDEVGIWNRALSATEVRSVFSGSPPGGTGPGGQPTPPTGPTAPNGAPQQQPAPAISGLTVTPSAFAVASRAPRATHRAAVGARVSYIDSQAATSAFVVLSRRRGILSRGRCSVLRGRLPRHAVTCDTYVPIGGFIRVDTPGLNRFRFPPIGNHKLAAGRYRLDVTPRAHGKLGRTTRASFTIIP